MAVRLKGSSRLATRRSTVAWAGRRKWLFSVRAFGGTLRSSFQPERHHDLNHAPGRSARSTRRRCDRRPDLHHGERIPFDEGVFPTKGWSGMTLRVSNQKTHQWALYCINSSTGELFPPVIGGFNGGDARASSGATTPTKGGRSRSSSAGQGRRTGPSSTAA
jgi:hypothetical protein